MFREGTEAGKAAVQLQPDKPEGHFWLGANYGGGAAHSTIANLSSFQDIKREMEAVLKMDESYQGYSAYLGLGGFICRRQRFSVVTLQRRLSIWRRESSSIRTTR